MADGYGLTKPVAVLAADADWTFNFWVDRDGPVAPFTLLAGFGDGENNRGRERYLAVVGDGLRFWGGVVDLPTAVRLDPGRWQMLTAVRSTSATGLASGRRACSAASSRASASRGASSCRRAIRRRSR